jgi:hypothetical protein
MIAFFIVDLQYFFGSSRAETPQMGIDRRQLNGLAVKAFRRESGPCGRFAEQFQSGSVLA